METSKPIIIAASVGLVVGTAAGLIIGAVRRSNHLDKAEEYEKTANRLELYDTSFAGETIVSKAGELYNIAQRAVKAESLIDAKYVEQSAGKLKKEVDEIQSTGKNILDAYKMTDNK